MIHRTPHTAHRNNSLEDLKLLSVIIPAYNAEKYLAKCVESAVNQTYKNIEIIIVNNGSSDNTHEICEELKAKYNNIKIIKLNPNQGVNLARKAGVEAASGDYITFIDSDDYIDLNAYEKVIKVLEENDCDIVQFGYNGVDPEGKLIASHTREAVKVNTAREALKYFLYALPENSVLVWDKIYKRDLFENLEWPRLTYYEDFAANVQLFAKAKKFMAISENFYYHVIHPAAVSSAKRDDKAKILNDLNGLNFLKDFTAKTMPECMPEILYNAVTAEIVISNIKSDDPDTKDLINKCRGTLSRDYKLMKSELKAQRRKLNVKLNGKMRFHYLLFMHCPRLYKFYLAARLKIKALTGI